MSAIPATVEKVLEDADRTLRVLEDSQLELLTTALLAAEQEMEVKLKKLYADIETDVGSIPDKKRRAARIESRLANQRAFFDTIDQSKGTVTASLRRVIEGAHRKGIDDAARLIQQFEFEFPLAGDYDTRAVDAAIKDSLLRYSKHSEVFKKRAKTIVAGNLLQGRGVRVAASQLQEQTGILRSRAVNIVRTESINAQDTSRRSTYTDAGISHVQRLATLDKRVCKWCADRHGTITEINKAQLILHGQDRCTHIPIRPEWVEAGLIDLDETARERQAYLEKAGVKGDPGPAPYEKRKPSEVSHSEFGAMLSRASQAAGRDPSVDRKIRGALRDGEAALAANDLAGVQKALDKINGIDPDPDSFPEALRERWMRLYLAVKPKDPPPKVVSDDFDARKVRQQLRKAEAALADGDQATVRRIIAELDGLNLPQTLGARLAALRSAIGVTPPPPPTKPPPETPKPEVKKAPRKKGPDLSKKVAEKKPVGGSTKTISAGNRRMRVTYLAQPMSDSLRVSLNNLYNTLLGFLDAGDLASFDDSIQYLDDIEMDDFMIGRYQQLFDKARDSEGRAERILQGRKKFAAERPTARDFARTFKPVDYASGAAVRNKQRLANREKVLAINPEGKLDVLTSKWEPVESWITDEGAADFARMLNPYTLEQYGSVQANYNKEDRAFYRRLERAIFVNESTNTKTVVHELAHHLEYQDPGARRLAIEFLNKRTKGQTVKTMSQATGISAYDKSEVTIPDKFIDPYVGKIYDIRAGISYGAGQKNEKYNYDEKYIRSTEVISMGFDQMWHDPETFYRKDPEHFEVIYRIMVGDY